MGREAPSASLRNGSVVRGSVNSGGEGGGGFSASAAANVSLIREPCDVRAESLGIPFVPREVTAQMHHTMKMANSAASRANVS